MYYIICMCTRTCSCHLEGAIATYVYAHNNHRFTANVHASGLVCIHGYHVYVTVLEKTDHSVQIHFLQYGPKALQRLLSRDFVISMPRYSTAS